ncbi:MAG: helix-turn-helix transcriptional regulator [Lachnospiraceae bacterium]|nr:helix-turn-helix transcriptional regulator [Lachnospiraceae bacterium]
MLKDRRYDNRYIKINFSPTETFQNYPSQDYLTLTLITDGTWKFTLNHTMYCLDAPFILCLNADDKFSLIEQNRAAAKSFFFDPMFLNSSLTKEALQRNIFQNIEDMHDRNLIEPFLLRNDTYNGLFILNGVTVMQIHASVSVMGSECLSQSDGKWTCRIRRYLLQILYALEDEFILLYEKKTSRKTPLDHALEYIHSNYHLGLTLDDICSYVGSNRTTLNKQCKSQTGMTVIQYLNDYRLRMSEEALRHTNLNLNEIAICCGYNYDSYFIKAFSKKHGLTPNEYRKQR